MSIDSGRELDWPRASLLATTVLLFAACSVDAGNGFGGVMSASGGTAVSSVSADDGDDGDGGDDTATTSGSATVGSGDTGGSVGVDDTAGDGTASATAGDELGDSDTSEDQGGTMSGGSTSSDDSGTTGVAACMGAPLNAQLEVPPVCEPTCNSIGFGNDCGLAEICRLKDSATAVCESCVQCGNLHAPCTATDQCDILFTCFMGQCTAMCDFDTPQTCGVPAACTDVGHPTHGVCNPNI